MTATYTQSNNLLKRLGKLGFARSSEYETPSHYSTGSSYGKKENSKLPFVHELTDFADIKTLANEKHISIDEARDMELNQLNKKIAAIEHKGNKYNFDHQKV